MRRRRSYSSRARRSSSRKLTLVKGLKWAIALSPVAAYSISNYKSAGGGAAGAAAALNTVTSSYTGYDVTTGQFTPANLAVGYVPMAGAWIFGKFASRVLR